ATCSAVRVRLRRAFWPTTTFTVVSPRDPVVLSIIARPAPHRPVLAVEVDGVDRAGGERLEVKEVAHRAQLFPHPGRHGLVEREPPGPRLVVPERAPHLVARDVRRLGRLLYVHPELDDVEKELQQVLILRVAALHGH